MRNLIMNYELWIMNYGLKPLWEIYCFIVRIFCKYMKKYFRKYGLLIPGTGSMHENSHLGGQPEIFIPLTGLLRSGDAKVAAWHYSRRLYVCTA
jgi:hypothetical protein